MSGALNNTYLGKSYFDVEKMLPSSLLAPGNSIADLEKIQDFLGKVKTEIEAGYAEGYEAMLIATGRKKAPIPEQTAR
jgi:hypothetical protein